MFKALVAIYFQRHSCIGPCCRQIGYLISKEWIFAQNEEARDDYKKQYKKEKNRLRKARAKEEKLVRQHEEGEIEGGEIVN